MYNVSGHYFNTLQLWGMSPHSWNFTLYMMHLHITILHSYTKDYLQLHASQSDLYIYTGALCGLVVDIFIVSLHISDDTDTDDMSSDRASSPQNLASIWYWVIHIQFSSVSSLGFWASERARGSTSDYPDVMNVLMNIFTCICKKYLSIIKSEYTV